MKKIHHDPPFSIFSAPFLWGLQCPNILCINMYIFFSLVDPLWWYPFHSHFWYWNIYPFKIISPLLYSDIDIDPVTCVCPTYILSQFYYYGNNENYDHPIVLLTDENGCSTFPFLNFHLRGKLGGCWYIHKTKIHSNDQLFPPFNKNFPNIHCWSSNP